MSPLNNDLKTWSSSEEMYVAFKKYHFKLRAMIFYTIIYFPAYANLSGYSTKGKLAFLVCDDKTSSTWLKLGFVVMVARCGGRVLVFEHVL